MNNDNTGKSFDAVGRIRFENQSIEPTPEQQPMQVAKPKRKINFKKILIGLVVVAVLAVIGVVVVNIVRNNNPNRVLLQLGDFYFTERDARNYQSALQEHINNNPGVGFGDNLRQTAIDDLTFNTALKYYATEERCDIQVSAVDIVADNGLDIDPEHAYNDIVANAMLDTAFGETSKSNFRRIRAENEAYRVKLSDCIIARKDVFELGFHYYMQYFENLSDDEILNAYAEAMSRLENEFLSMFDEGLSTDEIASRADLDYRDPDVMFDMFMSGESYEITGSRPAVIAKMLPAIGEHFFNDSEESSIFRGDSSELVSANELLSELTEIGDFVGPFKSRSGLFGFMRLEGLSEGRYVSWDAFLESFDTRRFVQSSFLSLNSISVLEAHFPANPLVLDAYATSLLCGAGKNILGKITVTEGSMNGAGIENVTITNSNAHPLPACRRVAGGTIYSHSDTTNSNGEAWIVMNCQGYNYITLTYPASFTHFHIGHVRQDTTFGDARTRILNNPPRATLLPNNPQPDNPCSQRSDGTWWCGVDKGGGVPGQQANQQTITVRAVLADSENTVQELDLGIIVGRGTTIHRPGLETQTERTPLNDPATSENTIRVRTIAGGNKYNSEWQDSIFVRPGDPVAFNHISDVEPWRPKTPATSGTSSLNNCLRSNTGETSPNNISNFLQPTGFRVPTNANSSNCNPNPFPIGRQINANSGGQASNATGNNVRVGGVYSQNLTVRPTTRNSTGEEIRTRTRPYREKSNDNGVTWAFDGYTDDWSEWQTTTGNWTNTWSGQYNHTVYARVPHNYEADGGVTATGGFPNNRPLLGGQILAGIRPEVDISSRLNTDINSSAYATRTHPTKWRFVQFELAPEQNLINENGGFASSSNGLCSFYGGTCVDSGTESSSSFYNDSPNGASTRNNGNTTSVGTAINFTVPANAPLGTRFCFATGVYPASSWGRHDVGQQNNSEAMDYDTTLPASRKEWRFGTPKCIVVAKQPKVQFFGAGVHVRGGDISTAFNSKSINGTTTTYGSWSEYEALARDSIIGLSTGGALGNYGFRGANNASPINWNRQTITNSNMSQLGRYERTAIPNITRMLGVACSGTSLNSCAKRRNLSGGGTIGNGDTAVWVVDGDATISGDITYHNGPFDNDISRIPQAIIWVRGNLNIAPNVKQIDAWVVVDGEIDTCPGHTISTSASNRITSNHLDGRSGGGPCGNKLVFNGPVEARSIQLKRTAGSGTDNRGGCSDANCRYSSGPSVYDKNFTIASSNDVVANTSGRDTSNDPAEVFNLRGDAFLWALRQAMMSGHVRTTHTREIAPRF